MPLTPVCYNWRVIRLDETDSTNAYIRNVASHDIVVTAEHQSAGRGRGGNGWESEAGQNLLFSVKTSPQNVLARKHFLLSMAGALALKQTLDEYADGFSLKWPNDIYWQDKKISGTLIETTITDRQVQQCIFGVGVNVNQQFFRSDAPNPVSLCHILGFPTDRDELLRSILMNLRQYLEMLAEMRGEEVERLYCNSLYRREGLHPYEDCRGRFMAETVGVRQNGHLLLCDKEGKARSYDLNELKFII